jgi:hypothetical protein
VRKGNMVKTGHLPGSVHFPQRFSLVRSPAHGLILRDILFYM